jgi:hypothetical protein
MFGSQYIRKHYTVNVVNPSGPDPANGIRIQLSFITKDPDINLSTSIALAWTDYDPDINAGSKPIALSFTVT